jgi:hypothetical protein
MWISELVNVVAGSTTPEQQDLLQLCGVLSLGIGDAMYCSDGHVGPATIHAL